MLSEALRDLVSPTKLDELVRRVRELRSPWRAPEAVDRIIGETPLDLPSLRRHVRGVPDGYRRSLVYRDDRFQLLVLSWAPGARTPIHGHDRQDCWLIPVAGELDGINYHLLEGGRAPGRAIVVPASSSRLAPGTRDHRDATDDIHEVRAGASGAVSLHLYTRPFDRCLVYEPITSRCFWREVSVSRD